MPYHLHSDPSCHVAEMEVKLCESCCLKPSKYRCPCCDRRSCSLKCVRRHKVESGCSGIRCKTAFVSLNAFTDQQLLNDYYFLEDVGRLADSAHRNIVTFDRDNSNKKKRKNFRWLRDHASKRGIKLKLLSAGMIRHSINTSKTIRDGSKKQWIIHWRVHLNFPECDVCYEKESVSENKTICDLLEEYLHPVLGDPISRHRLRFLVLKGMGGVEVWLEGERGVAPQLLDTGLTLKENLSNKTLTEFPVLHVMTKGAGPLTGTDRTKGRTIGTEETPQEKSATTEGDTCATQCKSEGEWSDEDGECLVSHPSASLRLIANTYSDSEDGMDS